MPHDATLSSRQARDLWVTVLASASLQVIIRFQVRCSHLCCHSDGGNQGSDLNGP